MQIPCSHTSTCVFSCHEPFAWNNFMLDIHFVTFSSVLQTFSKCLKMKNVIRSDCRACSTFVRLLNTVKLSELNLCKESWLPLLWADDYIRVVCNYTEWFWCNLCESCNCCGAVAALLERLACNVDNVGSFLVRDSYCVGTLSKFFTHNCSAIPLHQHCQGEYAHFWALKLCT